MAIAVLCNDDVIKTSAIFLRMKRQYWVETKSEIKVHILVFIHFVLGKKEEILVKLKRHQNHK